MFSPMRKTARIQVVAALALAAFATPSPAFLFFWGKDAPYEETSGKRGFHLFLHPAKKDPARQLEYANQLAEAGRAKAAARQHLALVTYWPESKEAGEAQFRYARYLDRRGNTMKAFDEYQRLFDRYTGLFPYDEVLERQFELAKKAMDVKKGKFWLFPGFSSPERAVPMFEKIVLNGPQWTNAPEAQYLIGKAQQMALEYELAIDAYMTVQNRYPDRPIAEKAAYGAAYCYYLLSQESPYNEQLLEAAWAAMTLYLQAHSSSENAELAREYQKTLFRQRAKLAYEKANYYERARRPKSALVAYESFLRAFPHSDWTALAQARIDALKPVWGEEKKDETNP